MADKIVVLNRGRIEQVGSPLELYRTPRNLFVAGFIGSPRMNLISGDEAGKHDAATIGIRPEHLDLSGSTGRWKGIVSVSEHLGSDTLLHADVEGIGPVTVRADGEFSVRHGDTVWMTPQADKIHRFNAEGLAL
ncbi:MAG: ABC transporter ATP-binding protein, partial [Notoacmeibacter sp.]|nr:ABC transporter ATP-binding protein [Notoacmeibacter sp.]